MTLYPELLPNAAIPIRILVACLLIYVFIIVITRMSGKRSVSKMNSFDWIVTVALGSIVATAVVSPDSFGPAVIAATGLIALQWLITLISLYWTGFRHVLKNNPTLLVLHGELIAVGMRETHVGEGEILSAARHAGLASLREVKAMVLETDGSFSVISVSAADPEDFEQSTLKNLNDIDSLSSATRAGGRKTG